MDRVTLTVMMGVPGSGKSTATSTMDVPVVTLDAIRTGGRSASHVVTSASREVERLLADGVSVVVDSCNVLVQMRRRWLRIGRAASARCELVIVDTDPDVALVRNRARPVGERVDDDAMLRYVARWRPAVMAARSESWDAIRVVSGGAPLIGVRSRDW